MWSLAMKPSPTRVTKAERLARLCQHAGQDQGQGTYAEGDQNDHFSQKLVGVVDDAVVVLWPVIATA
jgi:hypothetical protein